MNHLKLRILPINWHPRYAYVIAGLKVNGQRRRLYFKNARDAEEELQRLKIKARRQGEEGLNVSDEVRGQAVDAARRLAPYGKTIRDATDFYLIHLAATESAQVSELVDNYIRAKERGGISARHMRDVRTRLARFNADFGARPCRTVTAAEIESWLYGLHDGGSPAPQTLVNWHSVIRAFFSWALRQKLVDANPADGVAKPRVVRGAPAIWPPVDLEKLLRAAPADLLPVLAIGAFGGLRTAELMRLDWSEVNLERGLIEITAAKAKSASRRLVKIEPNLSEWLAPYAGHTGPVWPGAPNAYHEATARLCADVGLEWRANALRHSYASFHLAHFESAEKLALQMGHSSSKMIFDHYREAVTPQAAQLYWGIRP